jgi:hypothetical protein
MFLEWKVVWNSLDCYEHFVCNGGSCCLKEEFSRFSWPRSINIHVHIFQLRLSLMHVHILFLLLLLLLLLWLLYLLEYRLLSLLFSTSLWRPLTPKIGQWLIPCSHCSKPNILFIYEIVNMINKYAKKANNQQKSSQHQHKYGSLVNLWMPNI